jgi:two-component system, OmpR family, sensor histidine kinase KdpD
VTNLFLVKLNKPRQYLISILLVSAMSAACFFLSDYIGYKVVALLLLFTVSFIAMLFNIWPVLLAAFLSALMWDFLFIPPRFSFSVHNAEDALLLLMYFIVAMVNAVLTYKIRQIEKETQKREEKEKNVALYNTLFNSLSHELRTPISTILGASDSLLSESGKLNEEDKKELLSEISKASLRLNRQVENLLNMTRLESGIIKIKKDWCDIDELVHDVVNRLKEDQDQNVITVNIRPDLPLFKLDYVLMEQVLHNLIHNALAYIPKYCIINVKAGCLDDKLVIVVEDNGYGFPDEEKGKVFDKFYRAKNTKAGGTGLGLSIVKGFVEAHDGNIILEDTPGGGARFKITIPAEISYLKNLKNE